MKMLARMAVLLAAPLIFASVGVTTVSAHAVTTGSTADAVTAAVPVKSRALVHESGLDRHTMAIAATLRCLVCQGESVADSQAGLAADMRAVIRKKLSQGWSDQRIHNYFVARYGDFVLYRPPLQASTWFLWFSPLAGLALGMAGLLILVRQRARRAITPSLTPEEAQRAQALLQTQQEGPP